MDLLCFCSVLCLLCLCARLFICALWSPAGKGLASWLLFVVSAVSLSDHIAVKLFFLSKASFVDLLCFCSVLCLLCLCAHLFICALWSPAGKGLASWLSFVVSAVSLSLSHWYPGQVWYLIVSIPDLCMLTYLGQIT